MGQKICRLCNVMEEEILDQRVLFPDASVVRCLMKGSLLIHDDEFEVDTKWANC